MVKVEPEQIVELFTVITGRCCTVTVTTAGVCDTQPVVPVPVMVYELVVEGVTVKVPPVTV
jgi:hypothetical protein